MRKLLVILFLVSNVVFSQWKLDQIPEKNFAFAPTTNLYLNGLNIGIEGIIQLPKHWFSNSIAVNPLWVINTFHNWAFNFNYSYFPNGSANRFDLFFSFNYIFGIQEQNYTIKDLDGNLIDGGRVDTNHDFSLGFGFNTNLSQRFFLRAGLGGGVLIATNRVYNWMDVSGNVRVSLGYRFVRE